MEETNIQNVNSEEAQPHVLEMGKLLKLMFEQRKMICSVCLIAAILSSAFILCIPRTYTTVTRVAPEVSGADGGGALSSLASSFGFDIGDAVSSDAISPLLYPDLMSDNAFVAKLFDLKVKSVDGKINCSYYDYIAFHQDAPWWSILISKIKELFPKKDLVGKNAEFDPYHLSRKQTSVIKNIRDNISLDFDMKTSVISISVADQDPTICKQIADATREKLQEFITDYRTRKARLDSEYYEKLTTNAKAEYEKARRLYGSFGDSNTDIVLPSYQAKMEDLENDMQLKFNAYTAMNTQLQAARAKVQENTPAFTLLQGAEVPIKPASPKRMIFVAAMTILAFVFSSMYAGRKVLFTSLA